MRYKPEHTCFHECPACAYELGVQDTKWKPGEFAKYVWGVVGSDNPCDIRRYASSHKEAVQQLAHVKGNYKARGRGGIWTLFKLVRVNKSKV